MNMTKEEFNNKLDEIVRETGQGGGFLSGGLKNFPNRGYFYASREAIGIARLAIIGGYIKQTDDNYQYIITKFKSFAEKDYVSRNEYITLYNDVYSKITSATEAKKVEKLNGILNRQANLHAEMLLGEIDPNSRTDPINWTFLIPADHPFKQLKAERARIKGEPGAKNNPLIEEAALKAMLVKLDEFLAIPANLEKHSSETLKIFHSLFEEYKVDSTVFLDCIADKEAQMQAIVAPVCGNINNNVIDQTKDEDNDVADAFGVKLEEVTLKHLRTQADFQQAMGLIISEMTQYFDEEANKNTDIKRRIGEVMLDELLKIKEQQEKLISQTKVADKNADLDEDADVDVAKPAASNAPKVDLVFDREKPSFSLKDIKNLADQFCAKSGGRFECKMSDVKDKIIVKDKTNNTAYQVKNSNTGFSVSYDDKVPTGDSAADKANRAKLASGMGDLIKGLVAEAGDVAAKARISDGRLEDRFELAEQLVQKGIYVETFLKDAAELNRLRSDNNYKSRFEQYVKQNAELKAKYEQDLGNAPAPAANPGTPGSRNNG